VTDGPAVLRDWSPADGPWYVGQLADPDIQRFTSEQPTTTADDFRAALARLRAREDHAGWVAPGFRGRGLASHALRQFCVWITAHWQPAEIVLWTHAENAASQRAAERAGFHYEPERDETKTAGTRTWPARWFIRAAPGID
jgi:ribosomal-protein-alanine N-acetyltransferase